MFKWLFGRKSIGGIVAKITKMRAKLESAIEEANEEIKSRNENIKKAEEKKIKAIQKAESIFSDKKSKELTEIDCASGDINEAKQWLSVLPTIDNNQEPVSAKESAPIDGCDSEEHH